MVKKFLCAFAHGEFFYTANFPVKNQNYWEVDGVYFCVKYLKELLIGVSLSSLYRFMDRFDIRKMEKRGSDEWSRRVLKSRRAGKHNGE